MYTVTSYMRSGSTWPLPSNFVLGWATFLPQTVEATCALCVSILNGHNLPASQLVDFNRASSVHQSCSVIPLISV